MDSPAGDSGKDSPSQASKESKAGGADDRASRPGSASAEVLRLQNTIKVKDKELDDARKEVMALKAAVHAKDRALHQTEQDLRLLKERALTTEGEVANMAKELAGVKVEKRKLEAQLAGLVRKGEKEQSMSTMLAQDRSAAAASSRSMPASPADAAQAGASTTSSPGAVATATSPGDLAAFNSLPSADHVAALQADLRSAKLDSEKAAEGVRVLENLLRNKDKQIHGLQRKLEEVEIYKSKCVDLENKVTDLVRQLETERAAGRTSSDVVRCRDSEKARLAADLVKARTALEAAQDSAARSSAALKVAETRCSALEQEVGTLVGQLARTSVVAQRVAVAEVRAGCKDEGMVHVTRHVEEVRFMSGEIVRLQERITALEKELAVSDELKSQYRRLSQPGQSPRSSPLASPSGTGKEASLLGRPVGVPVRPVSRGGPRTGSRPSSAPRRSVTASPAAAAAATSSAAADATTGSPPASSRTTAPRPRSAANGVRSSVNGTPTTGVRAASGLSATRSDASAAGAASPGATAASGGAIRSTFSSSLRRSQPQVKAVKKLPWNFNPKSPAKLVAEAAAGGAAPVPTSPLSPRTSVTASVTAGPKTPRTPKTPTSSAAKTKAKAVAADLEAAVDGAGPSGEVVEAAAVGGDAEGGVAAEAPSKQVSVEVPQEAAS